MVLYFCSLLVGRIDLLEVRLADCGVCVMCDLLEAAHASAAIVRPRPGYAAFG